MRLGSSAWTWSPGAERYVNVVNPVRPAARQPYKAGYRRFTWHDAERDRPVWADVWFPSSDASEERSMPYGLGQGRAEPFQVRTWPCRGRPFRSS
jgi:hypothetical protein